MDSNQKISCDAKPAPTPSSTPMNTLTNDAVRRGVPIMQSVPKVTPHARTSCLKKKKQRSRQRSKQRSSGSTTSRASTSEQQFFAKMNVAFDQIKINEFNVTIGDNPSARGGVPIQLGWVSQKQETFDLEEYESNKPARKNMLIPRAKRLGLVMSQGSTTREILSCTSEARKIQRHREESINQMKWDGFNENLEKAARKLKGMTKKVAKLTSFSRVNKNSSKQQKFLAGSPSTKEQEQRLDSEGGDATIQKRTAI
jgi:hypothetical protein